METGDRLDALLRRFSVRATQFHIGPVHAAQRYAPRAGQGFIHIAQAGELSLTHREAPGSTLVTSPSIVLVPRSIAHELRAVTTKATLACATVDFAGGERHPLVALLPEVAIADAAAIPGMAGVLELLSAEAREAVCGHRHVIDRLFDIVLIKLLRHLFNTAGATTPGLIAGFGDPHIARALTAMHEAPAEPWTLERLAQQALLSRSTFAPRFKHLVGLTPYDYLTRWRMSIAKQLLESDHTVTEAASALGYSSTSFSRLFAQQTGQAPRDWARQQRGHLQR